MNPQPNTPASLNEAVTRLPFAVMSDELAALHRFYETTEDGQDYDVPVPMMKRLATIGLVRRVTGNRYEFTDFGLSVRNGDFAAPAAGNEKAGAVALSDEQIIERCKAVGIIWLAPDLENDPPSESGFPGSFDMVTMVEMRNLLAAPGAAIDARDEAPTPSAASAQRATRESVPHGFGQGPNRFDVYSSPRMNIRDACDLWVKNWCLNYGDYAAGYMLEQALQDFEPVVDGGLRSWARNAAALLEAKEWAEQFPQDAEASQLEAAISKFMTTTPTQQAVLVDAIAAREQERTIGALQAECAGLTSSVATLSALVDHHLTSLRRAASTMRALHETAMPDEDTPDLDARIPAHAFRVFVDAHAELLQELALWKEPAAPEQSAKGLTMGGEDAK
jgi:hypothetical protein